MSEPHPDPARTGRGRSAQADGNGERAEARMGGPEIAGVVLAAGPSQRFTAAGGTTVKQLVRFEGESLVRLAVRAGLASRLAELLVVVGYEADAVAAEIEDLPVRIVRNSRFADGQSSSVRAALDRLSPRVGAALFIPCDQPFLDAATIDAVVERHLATGAPIVVPAAGGRRGAPVLFARALFGELAHIEGDAGGRQLFGAHRGEIEEVELPSDLPLRDIDTPADYDAMLELVYRRRSF